MAVVVSILTCAGCHEKPPPPRFVGDIGEGDTVVLAVGSTWMDPAVKDGRAEWQPFREPDLSPPPGGTQPEDDSTAGSAAEGVSDEVIRKVVAEYNEVIADGTIDELLDFYVEEQIDAVRPLLEGQQTLATQATELEGILKEKAGADPSVIADVLPTIGSDGDRTLRLERITLHGAAEAEGIPPESSLMPILRFVLVDGEWYMRMADADLAEAADLINETRRLYAELIAGLKDGSKTVEDVVAELQ